MTELEKLHRRLHQFQQALALYEKRHLLPPPERAATAYYLEQARKRLLKTLKQWEK